MGKRPVNSTKGGKFMNPTDQARKVARKRELKRNKKLRQMVRAAAIKGRPKERRDRLRLEEQVSRSLINVIHGDRMDSFGGHCSAKHKSNRL